MWHPAFDLFWAETEGFPFCNRFGIDGENFKAMLNRYLTKLHLFYYNVKRIHFTIVNSFGA
jgi:hypothetical protein